MGDAKGRATVMEDTEVDEESDGYISDQKDFEQLPESTSELKDDVVATKEDMQEAGRELDGIHHPEKKLASYIIPTGTMIHHDVT
jgi:hypothetical protein